MRTPTVAIILAGGFGTRLRSIVSDIPKPMAPVGSRPFLEYLIDYWITQGIQHFILSVGHLGEKIEARFGSNYRNRTISYVHESAPLGTGGSVRKVLLETVWEQTHAVLINGDTWFEVNLKKLVTDASAARQPITMAIKPMAFNDRYGGVTIDTKNRVTAFGINNSSEKLVNGGCYLLDIETIKEDLRSYADRFSLESDVLSPLAKAGKIAASIQDCQFLDIGTPADYAQALVFLKTRLGHLRCPYITRKPSNNAI
jgi:D-glycero-alpha-D-manno-heptose 1-phosphate guanylyltransferase